MVLSPSGDLVAAYTGVCPGCGQERRFEFVLDERTPPMPPAYGGDEPSQIICPGQFALVAANAARSAPPEATGLSEDERRRAAARLAMALAAQEEVLKFVPDGATVVPPDRFTSTEGWALYESEPGRFRRDRLAAVAEAYRSMLTAFR